MYYYHYPYPAYPPADYNPPAPVYPDYFRYHPIPRQYPPVDVKIFEKSVKSIRLLMDQGSILLDRLGDEDFDLKIMGAAQQGKKAEVENLIKTIGLKVPVTTKYTPTGITFELTSPVDPNNPISCCRLTVNMKWGN
jgi:hypothetical protein